MRSVIFSSQVITLGGITKVIIPAIAVVISIAAAAVPQRTYAATPICTTCIGVIGDSLTYQAGRGVADTTTQLINDGWVSSNIKVDALTGRPIANDISTGPGAVTTINNWKASGFDPQVYALFLGANNKNATASVWTTEINKDLTAIGPGHTIIWMGLGFKNATDSRVLNFNANLQTIAASRTDFFILKDNGIGWNEWIHAQPNQSTLWLSTDTDGVHMTFPGYALRNQFVGEALKPYAPVVPVP